MKDRIVMWTIIVLAGLVSYAIVSTAAAYEVPEPRKPTWSSPDIARCDKELWLRVKDGCKNNIQDGEYNAS